MALFGLFGSSSEDVMPPIFLHDNQEYTEQGYLITRNEDGDIERIINWQDHCQQSSDVEEEPSWPSLFG